MQQFEEKKDIISSIYWHLLTPLGCTRLWTIVYVGRTVLRVYYLICVPFIVVICNKRYYQQQFCDIVDMSECAGV